MMTRSLSQNIWKWQSFSSHQLITDGLDGVTEAYGCLGVWALLLAPGIIFTLVLYRVEDLPPFIPRLWSICIYISVCSYRLKHAPEFSVHILNYIKILHFEWVFFTCEVLWSLDTSVIVCRFLRSQAKRIKCITRQRACSHQPCLFWLKWTLESLPLVAVRLAWCKRWTWNCGAEQTAALRSASKGWSWPTVKWILELFISCVNTIWSHSSRVIHVTLLKPKIDMSTPKQSSDSKLWCDL